MQQRQRSKIPDKSQIIFGGNSNLISFLDKKEVDVSQREVEKWPSHLSLTYILFCILIKNKDGQYFYSFSSLPSQHKTLKKHNLNVVMTNDVASTHMSACWVSAFNSKPAHDFRTLLL